MESEPTGLWNAIKDGDEKAYESLFRTYYAPLCRFAHRFVNDPDNAEEIVQETFMQVWQKRSELVVRSTPSAYLYQAVKNKCLNHLRSLRVREEYSGHQMATQSGVSEQTSELVHGRELALKIDQAIGNLPPQCGEVFRLSRYEQLKYSEIADKLNISAKTVENHMGKALRLLRGSLHEYLPVYMITALYYSWI